jgi:hypothetical protein
MRWPGHRTLRKDAQRFTLHSQSVQCPDGYVSTIWYIWDSFRDAIVFTTQDAEIAQAEMVLVGHLERRWPES